MDSRPFRSASLAERTRGTAGTAAAPPTPTDGGTGAASGGSTAGSPLRRHCWVHDVASGQRRAPGLLVEWRQLGGAWQGRVAYVVDVDGEATLVEAWLPSSQLERAEQP